MDYALFHLFIHAVITADVFLLAHYFFFVCYYYLPFIEMPKQLKRDGNANQCAHKQNSK